LPLGAKPKGGSVPKRSSFQAKKVKLGTRFVQADEF
jgi:hypothetical protein